MYSIMRATSFSVFNCKVFLPSLNKVIYLFIYLFIYLKAGLNFIRWIRHYSGSNIYFTLNVVQGFRTLPNLAVVRVCIFAGTRGNTEIFAQIETVG